MALRLPDLTVQELGELQSLRPSSHSQSKSADGGSGTSRLNQLNCRTDGFGIAVDAWPGEVLAQQQTFSETHLYRLLTSSSLGQRESLSLDDSPTSLKSQWAGNRSSAKDAKDTATDSQMLKLAVEYLDEVTTCLNHVASAYDAVSQTSRAMTDICNLHSVAEKQANEVGYLPFISFS